jgi:hypothetical protein
MLKGTIYETHQQVLWDIMQDLETPVARAESDGLSAPEDKDVAFYTSPPLLKKDQSLCAQTLWNVTNFFLENNKTLATMFQLSGKDYNDFGRFD